MSIVSSIKKTWTKMRAAYKEYFTWEENYSLISKQRPPSKKKDYEKWKSGVRVAKKNMTHFKGIAEKHARHGLSLIGDYKREGGASSAIINKYKADFNDVLR
jgi:hypothetical protein